ncbi:MAG: hypothetical protein AAGJ18_00545 [Bacteroidota bacterium]
MARSFVILGLLVNSYPRIREKENRRHFEMRFFFFILFDSNNFEFLIFLSFLIDQHA